MAKVEGVSKLQATLNMLAKRAKQDANVSYVVGYTQNYALIVHENLDAHHPIGQAKYLEQPFRALSNDGTFSKLLTDTFKKTGSIAKGLLICALRLQRDSQQLVPVDTGALKSSAFTREERV